MEPMLDPQPLIRKYNLDTLEIMENKGDAAAGLGNKGAASATPSYTNMLKTNIRFDQRLKINVLEVNIEKSDKFAQVELGGDTTDRIL